jgi:negative regulator of sigma-B (phosphoserine phosphatase)
MSSPASLVEWAVAARPLEGGVSGDGYWITLTPDDAWVAVIDGLGHGPEAEEATLTAKRVLAEVPGEDLPALIRRCHHALRRTRGATISLAHLSGRDETMNWLGVGNVEGILVRASTAARPAKEHLLMQPGVVGYELPQLRTATLSIQPGDLLLLATDGISTGFELQLVRYEDPKQNADRILAWGGKQNDDALVLVLRYLGPSG